MAKRRVNMPQPEWSVPFEVAQLAAGPVTLELSPDDKTSNLLAQRLAVLRLSGFKVRVTLEQLAGSHLIAVQGSLQATVEQTCVNTLQVLESHIRDEFESWFADPAAVVPFAKAKADLQRKTGQQEVEMLDERDDPDPVVDGRIDLGELAVQFLSLAIDPYPHIPGSAEGDAIAPDTADENHPFAALAALTTLKEPKS